VIPATSFPAPCKYGGVSLVRHSPVPRRRADGEFRVRRTRSPAVGSTSSAKPPDPAEPRATAARFLVRRSRSARPSTVRCFANRGPRSQTRRARLSADPATSADATAARGRARAKSCCSRPKHDPSPRACPRGAGAQVIDLLAAYRGSPGPARDLVRARVREPWPRGPARPSTIRTVNLRLPFVPPAPAVEVHGTDARCAIL